ncbi:protein amnionless [Drosophila novamexicana]|uniref:protein amnionless n=1 Tax=Drosophila novamexicana TaxID=47314 RepID=UPI0011E59485|nr:protein amnionless [Drosophila novamexicana]
MPDLCARQIIICQGVRLGNAPKIWGTSLGISQGNCRIDSQSAIWYIPSMLQQPEAIIVVIFALLALEAETTTTIRWYSSGAAFDDPATWLSGYLPRARDLIVFPDYYPAVLPLPAKVSAAGFVLPRLGALLLAEDASIELAAAAGTAAGRAYLKAPKTSKWFDPGSWSVQPGSASASGSLASANSIVPEVERVPCDDEHVVISGNGGALSFDLEHVQYLRLGQLILAGSSISRSYLQELLGRDLGQLLFHNAQAVTVEYYRGELCGCHKDYERLVEPVCRNVEPECARPRCVSPLRPFGACCLVCGAMMHMPSEHCTAEDRKRLTTFIQDAIERQDLADELQLHVDYVGSATLGNHLQAIIVDRRGYNERSVDFMRRLSAGRNQSQWLARQSGLKLLYAGRPYNPHVSFASVMLILFCVLLVGVVSVIMLAHFLPEHPYLRRIPQWIHDPRRLRVHLQFPLRRNLLFNRFDNAAGGAGGAVIGYDAESGEVRDRAFNNPMFEQEPEPEQEQEPEQAARPQAVPEATVVPSKVETGELDSCSVEEQELTEINLESSGSESEAEAETKE